MADNETALDPSRQRRSLSSRMKRAAQTFVAGVASAILVFGLAFSLMMRAHPEDPYHEVFAKLRVPLLSDVVAQRYSASEPPLPDLREPMVLAGCWLRPFTSCQGVNLAGLNLSYLDLAGADLTRADLRGANLTGSNLFAADLTGAQLVGANLTEANLWNANLFWADLTDATLTDAIITDDALPLGELPAQRLKPHSLTPEEWLPPGSEWLGWSPCEPLRYVVSESFAEAGLWKALALAISEIEDASDYRFEFSGVVPTPSRDRWVSAAENAAVDVILFVIPRHESTGERVRGYAGYASQTRDGIHRPTVGHVWLVEEVVINPRTIEAVNLVRAILVHELLHVLHLGHVDGGSIMHPYNIEDHYIDTGEIRALRYLASLHQCD